jgi:putative flippase GtrA
VRREREIPGRLARLALSSVAASVVDLGTLLLLLHLFQLWPGVAGGLGCVAGGAVNFTLNRRWVFDARTGGWLTQLLRYGLLVVLGGALIAGAAIQLAVALLGLPVLLAKGIAAVLVLACWNYPVSSRLVFDKGGHHVC